MLGYFGYTEQDYYEMTNDKMHRHYEIMLLIGRTDGRMDGWAGRHSIKIFQNKQIVYFIK